MVTVLEAVELTIGEVGGLGPVRLRPWGPDDQDSVLDAFRDPDIIRWTTQVAAPSAAFVRGWLQSRSEGWVDGGLATWAVTGHRRGSSTAPEILLGSVGIKRFDAARRQRPPVHADVMYWIQPAARRHGLATAVASCAARWAWSNLGLHRVELHHEVTNTASCRVAERAGYPLEGTLLRSFLTPGGWVDEHLHAAVSAPADGPPR